HNRERASPRQKIPRCQSNPPKARSPFAFSSQRPCPDPPILVQWLILTVTHLSHPKQKIRHCVTGPNPLMASLWAERRAGDKDRGLECLNWARSGSGETSAPCPHSAARRTSASDRQAIAIYGCTT